MITYSAEGVKMPKIKKREISRWIKAVAATHGRKVGEIGYMFVDDEKILEVNNEYLGHDITRTSSLSTMMRRMCSMATLLSHLTQSALMPNFSRSRMRTSLIGLSFMVSFTSVVSMTRVLESVRLWKKTRTKHSRY